MSKLVECKACSKDVAKGVKKCPHCGKDQRNWFMRHKIMSFLGIIAIIIIASSIGSGDEAVEDSGNDVITEVEAEETEENVEETKDEPAEDIEESFKIGEPAIVGDVTFTVKDVEEVNEITSGNEFIDNVTTEGKFVILDIDVKNEKSEAITINSSFFKLTNGETTYEPTTSGEVMMAMMGEDDFFLTQINPGLNKSGKVAFEVAGDLDLSKNVLSASTGFFGTESVEISLTK